LQAHVAGSGLRFESSPLGVKLFHDGATQDWRCALAKVGEGIPAQHRDATRVAVIARGADALAQQQALLDAISLDAALDQLKHDWLFDVVRHEDSLTVHLQPLASFPPARLYGYECLLRGVAADGSIISPGKLIDAARRVDGIAELDERARVAAVRKAGRLGLREAQIFINFAPTAVADPETSLASTVSAIAEAQIEPNRITFEVVETERVADRTHLSRVLDFFRDRGFKIALDDVGAGYSSLLALVELLPDYIKIDGELIRRAAASKLEAKIVRDLADAAHQNGIISVAEGVETAEQMYFALECGIPILQGYFLSRPHAEPLDRAQTDALVQRIEGPDLAVQAA
jgi:EAL domain-containing protein (putative c-di-GMP-specific phosphodiesterase class I)